MKKFSEYKYYHPIEEFYGDISGIDWLKYDNLGVIMNSKDRLKEQYKISRADLYKNTDASYYYHPASISQCALACFNLIADGNEDPYRRIFMSNIKWLIENGIAYGDSVVYPFPFGLPDFHPEPNWVSGMYQGQVLSALVRAYIITNDNLIFSLCEKVWNSFEINLGEKYGFRYETDDELWFEEAPQLPPKHILNGSIYAIWGLYDYMLIRNHPELKNQWEKSNNTISNHLHQYDSGFWSYYDLTRNLASYYYHNQVHILQLKVLYKMTNDMKFKEYADKWSVYSTSSRSKTLKRLVSAYNFITRKRHNYNRRIIT
jgi:heparosan-N-sulfate-glucuronate 5-epimerase